MGKKPGKGYSLDRIDNNGDYEPKNCRWTTQSRQLRNTRLTEWLTIDDVTKSLYDWADESGIHPYTIKARLEVGTCPKEAVFGAKYKVGRSAALLGQHVTVDGVTRPIGEWAEMSGINVDTIRYRLSVGWDQKVAVSKPPNRKSRC